MVGDPESNKGLSLVPLPRPGTSRELGEPGEGGDGSERREEDDPLFWPELYLEQL